MLSEHRALILTGLLCLFGAGYTLGGSAPGLLGSPIPASAGAPDQATETSTPLPTVATLLPPLEIDIEAEMMPEKEQPPENQTENVAAPPEPKVQTNQSNEKVQPDGSDSSNKESPKKSVR